METAKAVATATPTPCSACPWRKSNHGKPTPHGALQYGWYTKANRRRLWQGLRTGNAPGMTCHPTDARNPLLPGAKPVPDTTTPRECAGALLLIIRELRLLEADTKGYFKANPTGLTKYGMQWWALSRSVFAGTPMGGPPIPPIAEDSDIARL